MWKNPTLTYPVGEGPAYGSKALEAPEREGSRRQSRTVEDERSSLSVSNRPIQEEPTSMGDNASISMKLSSLSPNRKPNRDEEVVDIQA